MKKLIETKNNELNRLKLQNEKLILEESNKLKSRFLAIMSHEIRTPMNGMLAMNKLLADTPLDIEQNNMLSTIDTCGKELLNILNDILEFSTIETGKLDVSVAPFELDQCIADILDLYSVAAKQKGIQFVYKKDKKIPNAFYGDVSRIKQILGNLISNAIKFTSEGGGQAIDKPHATGEFSRSVMLPSSRLRDRDQ